MEKDDSVSLTNKIRTAEKGLTKGLLKWRIKRGGLPPADDATLENASERIVDEAHALIKQHSKNIFEDLKQAKDEFLKAYRGNGEK